MAMHYNYDREPRDIECPECGEDAYELAIWLSQWGGEFHVQCDHCGLDEYEQRDSTKLDSAIEAMMEDY